MDVTIASSCSSLIGRFQQAFSSPRLDLLPLERHAYAVFLDDLQRPLLATLERRILLAARQALAPPAHRKASFAGQGLQHAVVVVLTERALHRIVGAFIGVVTRLAAQTLAPPANGKTIVTGSGVDHPIVIDTARRTFHREPAEVKGPTPRDQRDALDMRIANPQLPLYTKMLGFAQTALLDVGQQPGGAAIRRSAIPPICPIGTSL